MAGVIVFETARVRPADGRVSIALIATRPFDGRAGTVGMLECSMAAAIELRDGLSATIRAQSK